MRSLSAVLRVSTTILVLVGSSMVGAEEAKTPSPAEWQWQCESEWKPPPVGPPKRDEYEEWCRCVVRGLGLMQSSLSDETKRLLAGGFSRNLKRVWDERKDAGRYLDKCYH